MKYASLLILIFGYLTINCQTTIDGSFDWQSESDKKFNIYVPSNYDSATPNKLIVGFHPFNTSRWDSESWRDTLIFFAESVDAILLCTDGGPDGKVDDPIDTSFTSFMIDSIQQDFNINTDEIYGMGFSWGGRTTYTYGLHRPNLFNGHLVIGAAINGLTEVSNVIDNAPLKSFYLVHGSFDSPNTRFFPIKEALENRNACIETNLLQGVNHTIDFNNRNAILKDAFDWLENRNCGTSSTNNATGIIDIDVYPNPSQNIFRINRGSIVDILDTNGDLVPVLKSNNSVDLTHLNSGVYYLRVELNNEIVTKKILKLD